MSDDLYSDVYDDDTTEAPAQGGPKQLRDAYEREKEARKALEERLAAIEQESRQAKLQSALEAAGVNPKVADLVPADVGPDNVSEWVSRYGEVFGVSAGDGQQVEQPKVDAETQQQIAAVSGPPAGTQPASASTESLNALQGVQSEAELARLLGWT